MKISEAATKLNVSIDTLRRWDKAGIIKATRSATGVREFDLNELQRLYNKRYCKTHEDSLPRGTALVTTDTQKYSCIDLFAGAGGTALGLENAGFEHKLLMDIDRHAVDTLALNRPHWNIIRQDVSEFSFKTFNKQIDLLEGGFPCQAFSYAGNSKGFADTRGTLFFEFARAIQEVMPKVFIGENVKGLLRHDGGRTLTTMMKTLSQISDPVAGIKYNIAYKIVRSQYHDVPQKRERLIIIGVRSDISSQIFFPKERDYIVSLWDAIGDYPQSDGQKYSVAKYNVLSQVPPGGYWKDLPQKLQKEYLAGSYHLSGGKTGIARRLSWHEPSLTLTCSPAQKQTERCHPKHTRPLNVREYARIQSFPDTWRFSGGMNAQYKQIGNAVPVNLAFYLGRCAATMISGKVTPEDQAYVTPATDEEYYSS
ncbi:DNA (cytosine-5-)-methyltransferase [Canibacter sp. lx-45]|nr:DNA (cytosine-5-)-methyltransferase [Canibacter zhuwentaonis]